MQRAAGSTPFVVAIGGPSGSGKTSLVKAVAARLDGAAMLFFDDFADDPEDIEKWAALPGADYGRWQTPTFSDALDALRRGEAVTVPELSPSVGVDRSRHVESAPWIVIEEPFGRLRAETARSIDLAVCIDIPLEIALARRLSRQVATYRGIGEAAADDAKRVEVWRAFWGMLESFLDAYLGWARDAYGEQARQLLETSDLVVDGSRPLDELAVQVAEAAAARAD